MSLQAEEAREALEVCRGAAGEARREQEAAAADAAEAAAAFTAAVPRLIAAASAARGALQDLSVRVPLHPTWVHKCTGKQSARMLKLSLPPNFSYSPAGFLMLSSDSAFTEFLSMHGALPVSSPTVDRSKACSAEFMLQTVKHIATAMRHNGERPLLANHHSGRMLVGPEVCATPAGRAKYCRVIWAAMLGRWRRMGRWSAT